MKEELLIAGFGGQGVLSMGKILAYSGVMQGQDVSWIPSYGPEMRGGTANVTVILSDGRISSPVVQRFDTLIALNQQSLDKFEKDIKPGGVLLYDPLGISTPPARTDISLYAIDAAMEAAKTGNSKVFNMIVLGAFLRIKPVVTLENVTEGLKKSLPSRAQGLVRANEQALLLGMEKARRVR